MISYYHSILTIDRSTSLQFYYFQSLLLVHFHTAFAAATLGCELFDVSLECDLSGWMNLSQPRKC